MPAKLPRSQTTTRSTRAVSNSAAVARQKRRPIRVSPSGAQQISAEVLVLFVAFGLILLIVVVDMIGADIILNTLGGSAFARPLRCGNMVCNIQESALTCPTDCSCAATGYAAKTWLGGASCCAGQAPSNGICCPLGTVWDGASCAVRVARDGIGQRIECTQDLRVRGSQGWVACPAVYSPVCTFNKDGRAMATLPSDCQACVDNSVAYYIRGECGVN